MILTSLINNIALIIVLSFFYSFLYNKKQQLDKLLYKILAGVIFGLIAIAGMLNPLNFAPGIIFDGRSIILSIAGLFGGGVVAVISVFMAGIYRYIMGGGGTVMGLGVIVTSGFIGVLFRYLFLKQPENRRLLNSYFMGVLVHLAMLLWMLTLPSSARFEVIRRLSLPVILIYPLVTVLLAKMLMDKESYISSQLKLKESEELYRVIFDQAAVGVAQIETKTGRFVKVNQKYCDILSMTRDELTSSDFHKITHPDDLQLDLDNMGKLKRKEIPEFSMEKRYIRPDQSLVWVNLTVSAMWDEAGAQYYHIAIVEDISEQKRVEGALQKSENDFKEFLETSADLVFRLNKFGRIDYISPRVQSLYGYKPEDLIGKNLRVTTPLGDMPKAFKAISTIFTGEQLKNFEINQLTKTGEIIPMEINALPFYKRGKIVGLYGIMRDITERKLNETELEKHQDHLEELVKERTADLEAKNEKLEHFNKLFIGREFRIKELRDKLNKLQKEDRIEDLD